MNKLILKTIEIAFPAEGHPIIEIENNEHQNFSLSLKFNNKDTNTLLTFGKVDEYRTLDNGELNNYWNNKLELISWFWGEQELKWKELEKNNKILNESLNNNKTEYLILGKNDSFRIISNLKPTLSISNR